jgi:hypothetical protein
LISCSTLDLEYKLGCTPHWWQLFKGMYETGNEVIIVPFLGDSIETLWWRTYPNPCSLESRLFNYYLNRKKVSETLSIFNKKSGNILINLSKKFIKDKIENCLIDIIKKERDIQALLFMNVPISFIAGIARRIKDEFSIPVAYLDGDMPTALPEYITDTHLKFNYYDGADLSEYDAFFTNSKGIIPQLKNQGAKNIHPIYYAADTELFTPLKMKKDIDISFYGYGESKREKWVEKMIIEPSKKLRNVNFTVGGGSFKSDLGNANQIGGFPYSEFRKFCCRSNICLNITRDTMATVYASASARPFELAALGACIVSNPVSGIEEWFSVGKEVIVVEDNEKEIIDIYTWLLDDPLERERIGEKARERILKEHTFRHRADKIIQVLQT